MKVGRRLAIKLLNASKFALGDRRQPQRAARSTGAASIAAMIARCCAWRSSTRRPTRSRATTTRARCSAPRAFFWWFCDDYLELVKGRRYGEQGADGAASANAALLRRCRCCCGCSRRSCRSSPKRSGRGGRRARFTAPRGRRPARSKPSLLGGYGGRRAGGRARVPVGDRRAVRSAQAAIRSEAAAEGADHQGHGDGRRGVDRPDADRRGRSARGAARAGIRDARRRAARDRRRGLRTAGAARRL